MCVFVCVIWLDFLPLLQGQWSATRRRRAIFSLLRTHHCGVPRTYNARRTHRTEGSQPPVDLGSTLHSPVCWPSAGALRSRPASTFKSCEGPSCSGPCSQHPWSPQVCSAQPQPHWSHACTLHVCPSQAPGERDRGPSGSFRRLPDGI